MKTVYFDQSEFNNFKDDLINDNLLSEYINQIAIRPELQCLICHGAVLTPRECAHCESLFCQVHIDHWLKQSQLCPVCKKKTSLNPIGRRLQQILDSEIIEQGCPLEGCNLQGKRTNYGNLIHHLEKECEPLRDNVKCSNCEKTFEMEDALDHYLSCEENIECGDCGLEFAGQEFFDDHDCIDYLLKDQTNKETEYQKQLSKLTFKSQQQANQIINMQTIIDDLLTENDNLKSQLNVQPNSLYTRNVGVFIQNNQQVNFPQQPLQQFQPLQIQPIVPPQINALPLTQLQITAQLAQINRQIQQIRAAEQKDEIQEVSQINFIRNSKNSEEEKGGNAEVRITSTRQTKQGVKKNSIKKKKAGGKSGASSSNSRKGKQQQNGGKRSIAKQK